MKRVLWICLCSIGLMGGSYLNMYDATGSSFKDIAASLANGKEIRISYATTITGEAQEKNDKWCGDNFHRFKVYIPEGLKRINISVVSAVNTSYYALVTFVHDKNPPSIIDYDQLVKKDDESFYLSNKPALVPIDDMARVYEGGKENIDFYNDFFGMHINEQGGWLYVQLIQATNLMPSDFGHINNPKVYISAEYTPLSDNSKFIEWLKNTKFTEKGEPVDGFSSLIEKQRYCYDYGREEVLTGIADSDITGYEVVYGISLDPTRPKLSLNATRNGNILEYNVSYATKDAAIEGIDVEINQNTTTQAVTRKGILIQDSLENCLQMTDVELGSNEGEILYSDNGYNWYKEIDNNLKNSVHHVAVFIENVFDAKQQGSMKIVAKMNEECGNKIRNEAVMKYSIDNAEKSIKKSIDTILVSSSSSRSSSSSSSMTYGGGNGGSNTNSGSNDESPEAIYCKNRGGHIVDGVCQLPSSSSRSSSSSSSMTYGGGNGGSNTNSGSNDESPEAIYCKNRGGRIVDGVCQLPSSSSQSSNSSSSEGSSSSLTETNIQQQKIEKVVNILAKKELPVQGYFVHYGSGAFDWIYYSSKGRLYKLDGMDENGYFQWISLTNYFTNIEVRNGKIILGEAKITRITREFDSRTLNIIRSIRKQSSYPVNGYFTKYGTDAFDWVYVTGAKLYKLDGMDKNGYFKWLPLTDYFDGIEVQDYAKIKIGENRIEKELRERKEKCENDGGQWKQEEGYWMCIWEENIVISSSTSSSSSSSSFISSSSSMQSFSSSSTSSTVSSNSTVNSSSNDIGAFPNLF